jgi:immunity protein Imm1 of predicted polymorphic toxin system
MQKWAGFDTYWGSGWPDERWMEPFFLTPAGQRSFRERGCDSASLSVKDRYGTDSQSGERRSVNVVLGIYFNPDLGVFLHYRITGNGIDETYESKGDTERLLEWVISTHGTTLPVGLFIPFERAWQAVKEFMRTDGDLPRCIEWIRDTDLPPGTWPDPGRDAGFR